MRGSARRKGAALKQPQDTIAVLTLNAGSPAAPGCKRTMNNCGTVREGGRRMKGYYTENGYMGYVDGRYMLFASEDDYRFFLED